MQTSRVIGKYNAGLLRALRIAAQIAGLVAVCAISQFLVRFLNLAIPGFLLGMLLMLALLAAGIVKLQWIEEGASLLLRHLSFFFIPIAVGLMAFGPLFREHGLALLATVAISALLGIAGTSLVTQALSRMKTSQ